MRNHVWLRSGARDASRVLHRQLSEKSAVADVRTATCNAPLAARCVGGHKNNCTAGAASDSIVLDARIQRKAEIFGTGRRTRVTPQDVEQLKTFMQGCFKYDGPYTLTSGRQSNYYYDGKGATQHPVAAWLIGNALIDVVLESEAEAVGGIEIGAVPIADAIGIAAHVTRQVSIPTFIVRKQAKAHGTGLNVSEANMPDGTRLLSAGRRVAIVDDVITTGGSIQKAIDAVQELGCMVTVVIALVERHESAEQARALHSQDFPVKRLFYTNEEGQLFVDDEFLQRTADAPSRLIPR